MDNKTGSIIYNISISLKGNVRAAKELMSVYVADGKAAVIGREELVDEALHNMCIYTGDDNAYEHYIPVRVPRLSPDLRSPIKSQTSRYEYYLADKEKYTGRLCFSKEDSPEIRIMKGNDDIIAWIYISDDGDVPDAEESLLRGSHSITTRIGLMNVIYPPSESENHSIYDTHDRKKNLGMHRRKPKAVNESSTEASKHKKRNKFEQIKDINSGNEDNRDIPVLIMDNEMVPLNKPRSLSLGALASGLKDSFQDIGSDLGKAQDFEFMQDFCGFVFTHGVIMRYQKELGVCIDRSDILDGSADEAWLEHLQSMSRAVALLEGRNYVLPSDVDFAATSVSAAHISVTPMARAQGYTLFSEIQKITGSITDPDEKERI